MYFLYMCEIPDGNTYDQDWPNLKDNADDNENPLEPCASRSTKFVFNNFCSPSLIASPSGRGFKKITPLLSRDRGITRPVPITSDATNDTSLATETTPLLQNKSQPTTSPPKYKVMLETRHHWLPIILAIFLPVSFIITYSMAVAYDHVEPGFPYISDTGTFPPESCVFGQLLNTGAVISGIIVYIRYRHIHILFENNPERQGLLKLNAVGFGVGMVTNLGVSIVGNFQESNVIVVHLIGAFLAFFVGFIYCVIQTVISYKTAGTSRMMGNTPTIRIVRVVLCVLNAIFIAILLSLYLPLVGLAYLANLARGTNPSFIFMVVGTATPFASSKGPGPGKTRYKWMADDPGYTEHLVATISEWLVAICVVIFLATFYQEFKHFRVTSPTIVHYEDISKRGDTPNNGVSVIST